MIKKTLLILIVAIGFSACNHFEAGELSSQFLFFQDSQYKAGNITGFKKGGVPDIHVVLDGKTTGLLRLPQRMAFNPNKESTGAIFLPAVPMDGKRSKTTVYPLLKHLETFIQRDELAIDTFNLVFDYKENVKINTLEGFEFSNLMTKNIDNNPNTNIEITNETSYEGDFSGKIHLTTAEPIIHVASNNPLIIESTNIFDGIFLELTYKNEVELWLGLTAKNPEGKYINKYKIYLSPKDDWNTVYVDLTDIFFGAGTTSDIRLAIGAEMDTNNFESADIYIDNIKLLYH